MNIMIIVQGRVPSTEYYVLILIVPTTSTNYKIDKTRRKYIATMMTTASKRMMSRQQANTIVSRIQYYISK